MADFEGLELSQYCVREGELDGKSVVYDIYHRLPHVVGLIGLYWTGSQTFTNRAKLPCRLSSQARWCSFAVGRRHSQA